MSQLQRVEKQLHGLEEVCKLLDEKIQRSELYFYINGAFVANTNDTTYAKGGISFVCYNALGSLRGDAFFRDVSVRDLGN